MKHPALGFIGVGNMAGSLIGGLIANGYGADAIWVSDADPEKVESARERFHVRTAVDNPALIEHCQIVVLAVKPQVMAAVAGEIAAAVSRHKPLVVSIAAGVTEADIDRWLGGGQAIVRCMPNTPALVRTGATALHGNPKTTREHRNWAETIMRSVGVTVWVEREDLLDAVTALSGSGPAYFLLFMEAMERVGSEMGLDAETARLLTQQTALGSARMAIESEEPPAELRRRVTSPGGTTERAIAAFERAGLSGTVRDAILAARARAVELSVQLRDQ